MTQGSMAKSNGIDVKMNDAQGKASTQQGSDFSRLIADYDTTKLAQVAERKLDKLKTYMDKYTKAYARSEIE